MNYLNKNGYSSAIDETGTKHVPYKWSKSRISEMFKDPFYTGVLKYGNQLVNLTDIIYDFIPMVSVDDFLKINKFRDMAKAFKYKFRAKDQPIKADLLDEKVICGYCNESMTNGITAKKGRTRVINYFYYRCDTEKCRFYGKSVRAKVIVNFAQAFLEQHKFASKETYNHYVEEMKGVLSDKEKELESRRKSLLQLRRSLDDKIENTKDLIRLEKDDPYIRQVFKKELKDSDIRLQEVDDQIEAIKKELETNKQAVLSYSEFLELLNDLPVLLRKSRLLKQKDFVIGKIFLNFVIKDKNVASYQLNPPFSGFIEKGFLPVGRGGGN